MRLHTGELPYECKVCQRRFRNLGVCITHTRTVHERRIDYICNECGKGFTKRCNYKVHLKTHNK